MSNETQTPNTAPKPGGLSEFVTLKSGGWLRYLLEEIFNSCLNWIPGPIGHLKRWFCWRLLVKGSGWIAIERGAEIFGSQWIELGKGVYIGEGAMLQGRPGGIKLGEGVRIMPRAVLNVYNYRDLPQSKIEIGRGAVVGIGALITGQGGVLIEENAIIAPGVKILPINHNYSDPGFAIKDQGISAKGIVIRKGAWLGAGAIVLDGVEVGANAVVAAGSVVTDSVAAGAVVGGNPAQVLNK
jgi:acetyltransferase-like isoleucine patch superfamily enzyme